MLPKPGFPDTQVPPRCWKRRRRLSLLLTAFCLGLKLIFRASWTEEFRTGSPETAPTEQFTQSICGPLFILASISSNPFSLHSVLTLPGLVTYLQSVLFFIYSEHEMSPLKPGCSLEPFYIFTCHNVLMFAREVCTEQECMFADIVTKLTKDSTFPTVINL